MKRFAIYLAFVAMALAVLTGCVSGPRAEKSDFRVLEGAVGGKIMLDCEKGSTAYIRIAAKHDWEVLEGDGFVCNPSYGPPSEDTTIEVKALRDNNTTDTVKLDDIHFRLLKTRFVGMSVHQLPRMTVDRSQVILSSSAGATNRIYVKTNAEWEISCPSNASFSAVKDSEDENAVVVTALGDNDGRENCSLGKITISLVDAPSCRTTVEVVQLASRAPQTIIFYALGTSLSIYFDWNVKAMLEAMKGGIQGESRVVAFMQSSTTNGAMYELRYDPINKVAVKEKVKDIALPLPYSASLLQEIVAEAVEYAPAEQYAMIIGSHGTGWLLKDVSSSTQRVLFNMGLSVEEFWRRREDAVDVRHIGDESKTQYDIAEIVEAVEANDIHFEYILFDACYMSNIEAAYDLRGITHNIVASPCEVLGGGFPYAKVLPALLKDGGRSYDLDAVCREYVEYYKSYSTPSGCVAHIVTEELETLAERMKAVNNAERRADFDLDTVQPFEGLSDHIFYDLEDFVIKSCADEEAVEAFKAQMARCVPSRYHTAEFYSIYGPLPMIPIEYYGGVTTSADVREYASDWMQTAWYRDTH
ncbi:MAG: hypothetical protein IKV09_01495 [Alistipes sp.]|nr:hypothetical protein [Alistipes sp.]